MAKFVFIKMDGCGHCDRFQPVWNELVEDDELKNKVKFDLIMSTDKHDYEKYTVSGYPTILLDIDGKTIVPYNKGRTVEEIKAFINTNLAMYGVMEGVKKKISDTKSSIKEKFSDAKSSIKKKYSEVAIAGGSNQDDSTYEGGKKKAINDEDYKIKYLKYKAKYLKLKSSQF